jgi:tRNA threonylcarbamoyladenosine biosynthesis protein TsaB
MRILAIETSSRRGSVALIDGTTWVAGAEHEELQAHAERTLPLIRQVLAKAGWSLNSLDRVAVGIGPGSFVGLRVGIALADGLALGIGRPVVGVPSLDAMLAAPGEGRCGPRAALLDARRGEVFCAARDAAGQPVLPATAVSIDLIAAQLAALGPGLVLVGEIADQLGLELPVERGPELDLPHARHVALLAASLDPENAPPIPLYVRGAGAIRPNLPPSPLGHGSP